MPNFRILSLNGGGMKGVYSASFLAELEHLANLDRPLADYFDLIVGTSTGGLIALALALHQPASSIRDFYIENGPLLFPTGRLRRRWLSLKHWFSPKHDDRVLSNAIQKRIGSEVLLGEARRPLVITSFHAATGKPVCFKTRHHSALEKDHKRKAWEVAMATSAAPTFYRAFESNHGGDYIDGGIWANCPILVGVLEAVYRLGVNPANIDVLNIGTTRTPFHVTLNARKGGKAQNAMAGIDMLMSASMESALNMARYLVGPDRIQVIDTDVEPGRFALDNAGKGAMRDLRSLGEEKAKAEVQQIKNRFLNEVAAPWKALP